jgi:hypothetical protein
MTTAKAGGGGPAVTIESIRQNAQATANQPWACRAARIGFAAKGIVNAIIGVFALRLALGHGGAFLDSRQATKVVALQPFGTFLLLALGAGLACHAAWLLYQAVIGPERRRDSHYALKRVGWGFSSLIHALLAATAFQTVIGASRRGETWVQTVLHWQGGRYLMMIVGAIVVAVGIGQLYQAYTARFREDLDTGSMSGTERLWAIRIGRFGLAARGVVLPIVGYFLLQAGLRARAAEAGGTGAALREIASQTWGTALVAVVAAGFIAYALYMGVNAKYRRAIA